MYLVELIWVERHNGFISEKNATVRIFRTEEEAIKTLDELFNCYYLNGDIFVRTAQNFVLISKRINGEMTYKGRISLFDID